MDQRDQSMEGSYCKEGRLSLTHSSKLVSRTRPARALSSKDRKVLQELKEDVLDVRETLDLLLETRKVFPECTSLKENSKGGSIVGMFTDDIDDSVAFRQLIMND